MLNSAEIRWFFRDEVPSTVSGWFRGGKLLDLESRDDQYLVFGGSEAVGVKLRDINDPRGGKFEVKATVGSAETLMVSSTVHGRSDTWVKWSFGTDGFAPWVDAIVSSEPTWVTAHKERMLRKFDLDGDMVAEVPIDQRPVDGCNVELVRLAVGRDVWWTFGFESFGPRERVRANLLTVLSHWFKTPAPVSLDTTNSVPYSAWAAGALI